MAEPGFSTAVNGVGGALGSAGARADGGSSSGALTHLLESERDRWFLWLPVLYGCGVAFYFMLPTEPGVLVAVMPLLAAVALHIVWRLGTWAVIVSGAAIAMTLGLAIAKLRTEWVAAPVLERQLNLVDVRGFVELVEPRPGRGQRLTLAVASIRGVPPEKLPRRVRIRTMVSLPGVAPGDGVRLRATIAPPARPALPGDYDFGRAAFFQGLGAVGYALTRPEREAGLGEPPLWLRFEAAVARVRQAISERVRAGLAGERGGIADALITGERGGIGEGTNNAYRDSGLYHILSISGLHMTIMAGAVFFLVRFMLALVPGIALRFPIKKWAAVMATLAALGYLMISGAAFATVRSWVMISIMFLAVLLDRPAVAMRNVAVSALAIMLVLPESLYDAGFQMSYAAVVALVAAFEELRARRASREGGLGHGQLLGALLFFGGIVGTTLIASIAVAPFAAYHFHKSQQYAVLANLIAIPACNIVVMPAALVTLLVMPLGLEALPLWVMGLGIDLMTWVARAVAALPGAVGRLPAISVTAFGLMVVGGLWLTIWRRRWRLLGLIGVAAGLAVAPLATRPDLIVGGDGRLVAVRDAAGRLSALPARGGAYELSRWLEHDGDARQPRDAAKAEAFRCDAAGCVATVKGMVIAVSRHPSAVPDDCARAGLVVMTLPRPKTCTAHGPVIDLADLRRDGTHAVYLPAAGQSGVTIATVGRERGDRPWTGRRTVTPAAATGVGPLRGSRLGQFSPPFELGEERPRLRPEIEDDDMEALGEPGRP